jgi:hypothetical protein
MNEPSVSSPSIRGISYPLKVKNGNLSTSSDYSLVSQQIRSVVETRFFERVMRADYGIGDHTLDIIDPDLINSEIQTAIRTYVNGISSLSVLGDWLTAGEDGIYRVSILYSVNGIPQPPVNFSLSN